ncbi:hypothetical protein PR048_027619 [Dryococelus australis]|uniref:Uncharacterized protein n=1 Tax=Dryococelus australis TaxID=614101 RepID=A0ABQ9GH07_9NEOP|nr:hypothetical protein PR048_027619 [Dryococelus australis]
MTGTRMKRTVKILSLQTWSVNPLNVFGPAIESNSSSTAERFLPESPYCIIKKRAFSYVPWIQGVLLDEGLVMIDRKYSTTPVAIHKLSKCSSVGNLSDFIATMTADLVSVEYSNTS